MMEMVRCEGSPAIPVLMNSVFSALVVALQMIELTTQGKTGPLKYDRRVIIVTDGRGSIDTDDLDQIISKINDERAKVEIVLLGVDFDDADYGYKEENKDPHKVVKAFCSPIYC